MDDSNSNHRKKRRTGIERRQFSYTHYVPERRKGKDRRQENDNDQPSEGNK
jgi:hypothetical protein